MSLSSETLDFLFENRINNSKEWYDGHKNEYSAKVVEPLAQLVISLTPTMLEIDDRLICEPKIDKTISRIRRDTRFSRDKSLYRDTAWLIFIRDKKLYDGLPGFFFELSPSGFRYGCGYYQASREAMDELRRLVLRDDESFLAAQAALQSQTVFGMEAEAFKRSRYADENEDKRLWLDRKNICFICNSTDFGLLFSDSLASKLAEDFKLLKPVYDFMMKAELGKQS